MTGSPGVRTRHMNGLAVSEAGERAAVPVLFLHGIGSSRSTFALQFAHVGRNRWCVAPDAPGYGDSDDNPAIVATDDYGAAIVDLLDQLEVRAADLVGVSWGGVIAARLAATHPERVARLVLADSTRGSAVDPARAAAMRARPGALASDGAAAFSQARSHRLLSPAAPSELVAAVAADMAAAIRLPGYAQAANAMARTDNTELFAMIGCPTLVIVGEHDVVCPPAEAAILTEHIHGASLVTIPDAGHLSNRENPIAFNRALDTFWADHPLAGGVG